MCTLLLLPRRRIFLPSLHDSQPNLLWLFKSQPKILTLLPPEVKRHCQHSCTIQCQWTLHERQGYLDSTSTPRRYQQCDLNANTTWFDRLPAWYVQSHNCRPQRKSSGWMLLAVVLLSVLRSNWAALKRKERLTAQGRGSSSSSVHDLLSSFLICCTADFLGICAIGGSTPTQHQHHILVGQSAGLKSHPSCTPEGWSGQPRRLWVSVSHLYIGRSMSITKGVKSGRKEKGVGREK